MYVRCDESSLYSRINYVKADRERYSRECPGIIKTMHTGFSAYVLHYANAPRYDTEETGHYDLARKDLCKVFQIYSVNSNELSKV